MPGFPSSLAGRIAWGCPGSDRNTSGEACASPHRKMAQMQRLMNDVKCSLCIFSVMSPVLVFFALLWLFS